jgi:hypothetical protein
MSAGYWVSVAVVATFVAGLAGTLVLLLAGMLGYLNG